MGLNNALLVANVAHARLKPKRHAFAYRVYYSCMPIAEFFKPLDLSLLSLNRFNLFSIRSSDYGEGSDPEAWIRNLLVEWSLPEANGEIVLLTMPRLFGYAFNPVSFWFCLDTTGNLRAVLSEVRNTFGEKHCYWSFHDDRRPITSEDWLEAKKIFHVSPFIPIEGHYRFRFAYGESRIGVWIDHHDAEGKLLVTSLVGERSVLSSRSLLSCFFRTPLVTFKVITLIHVHALRLVSKGIKYRVKPTPPSVMVSR